jgi:uncharacterized membrane protein
MKNFIKTLAKCVGITWLFAFALLGTLQVWAAYLSGNWIIQIYYNSIGEGFLELILVTLGVPAWLYVLFNALFDKLQQRMKENKN